MQLRVLFVTEDDPLYVIHFFEVFLEEYPRDELEVVGITVSRAFNESKLSTARRLVRVYGVVDFVRLASRYAATKLRRRSIAALAANEGIPLIGTGSVNDAAYIQKVRELRPDVIVSIAAPELFKDDLLRSARLACLNLHSGRLPRYRGMMPSFWQMLHCEPHVTVTVHEMAPRFDAGAVVGSRELPIRSADRLARVMAEGKREGARLMIRVLHACRSGSVTAHAVDLGEASYFSFPAPADVRDFRKLGHSLL